MHFYRKRIWQERVYAFRYYKNLRFALIDLTFGLIALFSNPYRICRKFLEKRGEKDIYVYGETPYTTYARIAKECGLSPNDAWIELGAGRGKGCFWLRLFIGCRVVGVERIPQFIFLAKLLQWIFRISKIEFRKENIEKTDLKEGTILYLYGLFPELKLEKGARIITTGEPLAGYRIIKSFWVRFPWGRTTAFLQEKP
jgi:hypothetical protein